MIIQTLTVEDYYSKEGAKNLASIIRNLSFKETEFGKEIIEFNMIGEDADVLFSKALNIEVTVDKDRSGVFRYPKQFIHFEGFDSKKDWVYVVALEQTMFNIYRHKTGIKNALEEYKLNYTFSSETLFDWDYVVNYQLDPGQGVFFRPWLFHSFDGGLIQTFRLTEK